MVFPAHPPEDRRPLGVHMRAGQRMRGDALRADAIARVLASVDAERPSGMSNAELRAMYDPPLSLRKAEEFGAAARRQITGRADKIPADVDLRAYAPL